MVVLPWMLHRYHPWGERVFSFRASARRSPPDIAAAAFQLASSSLRIVPSPWQISAPSSKQA
jgi:hypothetical protein